MEWYLNARSKFLLNLLQSFAQYHTKNNNKNVRHDERHTKLILSIDASTTSTNTLTILSHIKITPHYKTNFVVDSFVFLHFYWLHPKYGINQWCCRSHNQHFLFCCLAESQPFSMQNRMKQPNWICSHISEWNNATISNSFFLRFQQTQKVRVCQCAIREFRIMY